jgi:hypothetical protein
MKTLMCSLAAILSVALSSAIFAASDEYVVTGTVVKIEGGTIEIDEGKHDGRGRFEVVWDTLAGHVPTPKVGERGCIGTLVVDAEDVFTVPIRLRSSATPREAPRSSKGRVSASRIPDSRKVRQK